MRRFPYPCPQVRQLHALDKYIINTKGPPPSPPIYLQATLWIHMLNYSSSSMDWCSWLSNSNLHPILAQEYGLLFNRNELEEDDVKHLNHELLQSMGISVAKHRLEILKLARKERKGISAAMKKFSKYVVEYVRRLARGSSSAIVSVPKTAGGMWRARRGRRLRTAKPGMLMITNGSAENGSRGESGGIVEVRWRSMFKDLNPT